MLARPQLTDTLNGPPEEGEWRLKPAAEILTVAALQMYASNDLYRNMSDNSSRGGT